MSARWCGKRALHLSILGCIGLTLLAGCFPVHPPTAMGTGTFSYATGALSWIYPVTLEKLWPATLAEVSELRLQILNQHMDGLGATIKALRADKVEVDFELVPVSARATRLSVRILTDGWKRKEAEHFHAKIRQRLGLKL